MSRLLHVFIFSPDLCIIIIITRAKLERLVREQNS
jgi:hypothetical protein